MDAIINQVRIPKEILSFVSREMANRVFISIEANNQQQWSTADQIIQSLHIGDSVHFDIEDSHYNSLRETGKIEDIKVDDSQSASKKIRIAITIKRES